MPEHTTRTHVFVTHEDDAGFSAVSPQLPGFSYGRATQSEFQADYRDVLRDAGVVGDVVGYEQRRYESPEGVEYVIRVAVDAYQPERLQLAERIERALQTEQRKDLLDAVKNPMGEVTFVCAIPGDTVGSIAEQVDTRGDAIQVALSVTDEFVWTTQFAAPGTPDAAGWATVEERGWTDETTIGELVGKLTAGNRGGVLV